MRYIRYDYWDELSNQTRLPSVAAETIRAGRDIFGVPSHRLLDVAQALREGATCPDLILVVASPESPLTVYEGHVRLTAYMLAPECIPRYLSVMVGLLLYERVPLARFLNYAETEVLFEEADYRWMHLALAEAQSALNSGDYPVGAVLTVDGELWGSDRNSLFSDGRTTAHAEHNLVARLSGRLRAALLDPQPHQVCLYTTLEPCLMCLGITVLHRVNRIVVACPDPNGGTANLDAAQLGSIYMRWWPAIEIGLMQEESCRLIIDFLRTEKFRSWQTMLAEFEQLRESWQAPKQVQESID